MVTVAIAGATSGFGLTLVKTFIHLNNQHNNQHHLVLLSRKPQPELSAQGVDVRPVDYTQHDELVKALQGAHTLLSCMGGSPSAILDAQLALIRAAQATGVKRWAPSEYANTGIVTNVDLYKPKNEVWAATERSGLEYTRFACGGFMSLVATGTPKPLTAVGQREGRTSGEDEALAGLRPWNYVVNMIDGTADYPLDGSAPLVLTDTRDVATFVYHALSLPQWPVELGMRGEVTSFRDIVALAEEVQGRKWLTKETSLADMLQMAEDPPKRFYNQSRIMFSEGKGFVGDELNRAFPDVKPVGLREFMEKWWGGVVLPEAAWGSSALFGKQGMTETS